uniref:Senescence regulator S40 n=1 Tax=Nicotiana tabacum TaxID=4097 RepID=A0A1S3ZCZ3_TOBAC|nr:PREDICTED: uncharacterized protein LOC107785338 [Nicotiana tabacum]
MPLRMTPYDDNPIKSVLITFQINHSITSPQFPINSSSSPSLSPNLCSISSFQYPKPLSDTTPFPFLSMAEEFQEYEIIFQENAGREEVRELADDDEEYDFQIRRNNKVSRIKKLKRNSNSVPVNIPDRNSWFKYVEKQSDFFEDEYRDDEEMVPPHVITGRRIAGKMTSFSVCTGYGRTLKGRDLSQVRNSILRMTGFLET